jgi:hypothetical protein
MNRFHPLWITITLTVIAAGSLVNAVWALVAPQHWYQTMPDAAEFGPYNEHFVRDIGCIYLTLGLALAWSISSPSVRLPLVATVALFHVAHAVLHVFDTGRGYVPAHHWWTEVPTIYLPTAALLVVVGCLLRAARTSIPTNTQAATQRSQA